MAIAVPMMIGYGTIGAFVAARVQGNPLGWLMLTVGVSFSLRGTFSLTRRLTGADADQVPVRA